MLIDITLKFTPEMASEARLLDKKELIGHLGTHFDVMNKEFPLEYTERKGIIFDVRGILERDIDVADIDIDKVDRDAFVAFYSGYSDENEYGTPKYFKEHPQLSTELIDALLNKGISIIGVDFAGIRRGKEHIPTDSRCADRGVFVVENLCGLGAVLENSCEFVASTYPMSFLGITGLPCRVIAKV